MTDLTAAIAALRDSPSRDFPWTPDAFTIGAKYRPELAEAIGAVLNAVAEGRIGVAPTWQVPPEAERPDGFRCIGKFPLGWEECVWDAAGQYWRDTIGMPFGDDATRLIPAPPEAAP